MFGDYWFLLKKPKIRSTLNDLTRRLTARAIDSYHNRSPQDNHPTQPEFAPCLSLKEAQYTVPFVDSVTFLRTHRMDGDIIEGSMNGRTGRGGFRHLFRRRTEDVEYWRQRAGWFDDDASMEAYNNGVYDTYYGGDQDSGSPSSGSSEGSAQDDADSKSDVVIWIVKAAAVIIVVVLLFIFVFKMVSRRGENKKEKKEKKKRSDSRSRSKSRSRSRSRSRRGDYDLMDEDGRSEGKSKRSSRSKSRSGRSRSRTRSRSKAGGNSDSKAEAVLV